MSFRLSLAETAAALRVASPGVDIPFTSVSIDTRTLQRGALYVAIRGERHDGHDHVAEAERRGAVALVVQAPVESSLPRLRVEDTTVALGDIATLWASRFTVPTIAITGSNGKTTTKEILKAILSELGPVLATGGNLNNEFGVPLTLLGLRAEHRYAVIEMGARRAGDIERLVSIVRPDVAVVTNTGAAHLEGFGSLEGVAAAKSELYAGLEADGRAVINLDDDRAGIMLAAAGDASRRTFGTTPDADLVLLEGSGLQFTSDGRRHAADFGLAGRHNGMNALAAIAAAQCLDVQSGTVLAGLARVRTVPGRLERKRGVAGSVLIDDSYNANPASARAAVELLSRETGRRHLVLGAMLELGPEEARMHAGIGRFARERGIDRLWTLGPIAAAAATAFGDGAQGFDGPQALADALGPLLGSDDAVLVKGSRGSRMERVIDALAASATTSDAPLGEMVP